MLIFDKNDFTFVKLISGKMQAKQKGRKRGFVRECHGLIVRHNCRRLINGHLVVISGMVVH